MNPKTIKQSNNYSFRIWNARNHNFLFDTNF